MRGAGLPFFLNPPLTINAAVSQRPWAIGSSNRPEGSFRGERGTNTCRSTQSNATAAAGVDPTRVRIAGAIKQAACTTGTSFEYLLATAKMESNFNPKAGASTSSARGLFQFIDQTWLGTVKEAGAQLGYGKYADAITKNPHPAAIRSAIPPRAPRS